MREIGIYRGKRKDGNGWVEGYYVGPIDIIDDHEICDINDTSGARIEVDPDTVGQFTGLEDKNGVKVFKGDICQQNRNPKDLTQICFGEFPVYDHDTEEVVDRVIGWFMKVITTDAMSMAEPFCYDRVLSNFWIKDTDVIVIGNIHDNPELLEAIP